MLVLVGIDDSPSAAEALRWSQRAAAAQGGRVRAVRAWSYGRLSALPGVERLADAREMDERTSEEARQFVVSTLGTDAGVDISVVRGPAKHAIAAAALAARPDMVVVGRRSLGPVNSVLLGSVGRRLIETAGCPVVLMTEDPESARRDSPVVVVGVDGSPDATRAMEWAAGLVAALGGELVVVLVRPLEGAVATEPGGDPAVDPVLDGASVTLERMGVPHRVKLVRGEPRAGLEDVAEAEGADLLVVGSRGLGPIPKLLLGSVASYLVHHANRPIAILPPLGRDWG